MSGDKDSDENGGAKRFCLSIRGGEDQLERWKSVADKYFPSISAMIVYFVEKGIDRMEGDDSKFPGLRASIDRIFEEVKTVRSTVEMINARLKSENDGSEVREVARKILELLLEEGGKTVAEIHGELKYDSEVINGAIVLLDDLGLGDFKLKNLKGGGNEDD